MSYPFPSSLDTSYFLWDVANNVFLVKISSIIEIIISHTLFLPVYGWWKLEIWLHIIMTLLFLIRHYWCRTRISHCLVRFGPKMAWQGFCRYILGWSHKTLAMPTELVRHCNAYCSSNFPIFSGNMLSHMIIVNIHDDEMTLILCIDPALESKQHDRKISEGSCTSYWDCLVNSTKYNEWHPIYNSYCVSHNAFLRKPLGIPV